MKVQYILSSDVILDDNRNFAIEGFEKADEFGLLPIKEKLYKQYADTAPKKLYQATDLIYSAQEQVYFDLSIHRMIYGSLAQIAQKSILDNKFLPGLLRKAEDKVGRGLFDASEDMDRRHKEIEYFDYQKMAILACVHIDESNMVDNFMCRKLRLPACQYAYTLRETVELHDRHSLIRYTELCDWCPMAYDHLQPPKEEFEGTCFNGCHYQLRSNLCAACNCALHQHPDNLTIQALMEKVASVAQDIYVCPVHVGVRPYLEHHEEDD